MMIKVRILNPWVQGWTMVNIMMSQQIWGYTMSETTQRMAQPQLIRGHAHVAHRNAHAQDLLQLKLHLLIYWENRLMGYVAPNICSISVVYLTLRIGERMWKVYVSNPPSPVGLSPTEIDSGDSRRHTSLNPAGGTWLRTSVTLVSRLSECCTRVGNLPACRARVILERSQKGEQWARSGKEHQRACFRIHFINLKMAASCFLAIIRFNFKWFCLNLSRLTRVWAWPSSKTYQHSPALPCSDQGQAIEESVGWAPSGAFWLAGTSSEFIDCKHARDS